MCSLWYEVVGDCDRMSQFLVTYLKAGRVVFFTVEKAETIMFAKGQAMSWLVENLVMSHLYTIGPIVRLEEKA